MECATNPPCFVAQCIDRYLSQDNPWIAQIHAYFAHNIITVTCRTYIKSIIICEGKHASIGIYSYVYVGKQ